MCRSSRRCSASTSSIRPPTSPQSLAACQAVLLTSANGARALAEASEQRGRPILAVGDTTATTAEGLGFNAVTSAAGDGAALAELVRQRLDPKAGPLLHVSGVDVALDLGETLRADGFEVRRFALYDAREESTLPDSARAALQARALDAATFFSPRAASQFAKLAGGSGSRRLRARRHRHRHQPCRPRPARRPAVQGDRRGGAADPPGRAG